MIFSQIKHRFSHSFRSIRFHPMTPTCPSHRQGHGHYRAVSRHGPHGHQNQVSDGVQKRRQKTGSSAPKKLSCWVVCWVHVFLECEILKGSKMWKSSDPFCWEVFINSARDKIPTAPFGTFTSVEDSDWLSVSAGTKFGDDLWDDRRSMALICQPCHVSLFYPFLQLQKGKPAGKESETRHDQSISVQCACSTPNKNDLSLQLLQTC